VNAPPTKRGPPYKYGEAMQTKTIRLTPTQRRKLEKLGGDQWLRDQIDKA
jgi:hypothetical protein